MKNPNAVALGKASWKKRKKNPNHKKQLSEAGKAGAAKTNAIKAAKREVADLLMKKLLKDGDGWKQALDDER